MKHLALPTIGLLLLVLAPLFAPNPYYVHMLTVVLIFAVALMGLDLIVGYVGQISLGHFGLFAIGAYTAGLLTVDAGVSLLPALLLAALVTAFFGAILAFPALKTSGPYFAMVTLAFGSIVVVVINEWTWLTGGARGLALPKPTLAGLVLEGEYFYWFVLAAFILAWIMTGRLIASRYGRAFAALQGSAIATDSLGISSLRYKVLAFVLSAGLTGFAGGIYAFSEHYITPQSFNFELTIVLLMALIVGGRASRPGALAGAMLAVWLPNLLGDITTFRAMAVIATLVLLVLAIRESRGSLRNSTLWLPLAVGIAVAIVSFFLDTMIEQRLTIFGLVLLGAITYLPDGIVGSLVPFGRGRTSAVAKDLGNTESVDLPRARDNRKKTLELDDVTVSFGGLTAIHSLSVPIEPGTVHGLIGPNGAGKSTLLNILTGIYTPASGTVRLGGHLIGGAPTARIACLGVARTFQNIQLFGQMSVLENVLVGRHRSYRTGMLDVICASTRYRRDAAAQRKMAMSLLTFVGLGQLASEDARNLPYGKQRLLEIARALATEPTILLLDEPAAGLNPAEVQELVAILKNIKDAGVTMLLIEHHMDVVMALSDHITVLDFGEKIAEGTPQSVSQNPKVIEAYLGTSIAVA